MKKFNNSAFKFAIFVFGFFNILFIHSNSNAQTSGNANKLFDDGVTVLVFGDWGRNGIKIQQDVADQMGVFAEANNVQFLVVVGDNFYEDGVRDLEDPHWARSFEAVYTAPSLQVPWYVVLGNHDYRGNIHAQIQYTAISKRWKMPARYFSNTVNINDSTEALFVFMDSSPFVQSYYTKKSMKNVIGVDTLAQLRWVDSVLANSNAKYKIVAGHHPVFSYGEHGETKELITQWKPMLERHNVDLYLAGHEHDMQYLYPPDGTVHYFISGAGSETRPTTKGTYTKFAKGKTGGFLLLNFTDKIKAAFVDHNGNILYQTEITD
jgi:tartrate-resistant acid phosphatase type 5